MKKKIKWILVIVILLSLCFYIFLTPTGAIRFALFRIGNPIQAFTTQMTFRDEPYYESTNENEIMYTFENPPYAEATGTEMYNWIVKKFGIFYIASYYGWG